MNVNQNINKLLYALSIKGQFYKINTFKYYNENRQKYSTKYQILKKQLVEVYNVEKDKMELVEKYKQDKDCFNKIDVMKYLIDENRKGSEADGK